MKHMSETPKEQWTDAAENLFKFDDDKEGAESDFEDQIRSIYFYQQSFFRDETAAYGTFSPLKFKAHDLPESDSFCIGTLWKNKNNNVVSTFQDIDDQPDCDLTSSTLLGESGLSFKQFYFEPNLDFSCET